MSDDVINIRRPSSIYDATRFHLVCRKLATLGRGTVVDFFHNDCERSAVHRCVTDFVISTIVDPSLWW